MPSDINPSAERPPPAPTPPDGPEVGGGRTRAETSRIRNIRGAIGVLLAVLLVGLAYRQIGYSEKYAALERRQTHRGVMVPGSRGIIYDREHRVLAGNRTQTDAVVNFGALRHEFLDEERSWRETERTSADLKPPAPTRQANAAFHARFAVVQRHHQRICRIVRRVVPLDRGELERHIARERTAPFVLVENLTADEIASLSAELSVSDPVQLNQSHHRWYPQGSAAAHVVGRLRRDTIITPKGEDFPILNYIGTVGDFGMEKQFEDSLRGTPGEEVIRVDAYGFPVGLVQKHSEPVAGTDVVLSIDLDLQLATEGAMAATPGFPRGAAVAIRIATGEILAMASKPDFDLNEVSPDINAVSKERIDREGGWLNRATQGLYPPGSSFKVFTALAGLRRGAITPETRFFCTGYHVVSDHRFLCHNSDGHGDVSLQTGLARSCNVFAYVTGLSAGPDALADEARRFHFGEITGIDLPFEATQMLVPDADWKQQDNRGAWTVGDTINLSIGQGDLRYSPLQAACAVASLARRESLTVPTLLHRPGRRASGDRQPEALGISDTNYNALIDGMRAVVEIGIGRNAQVPGVSIAGKTGTAQILRARGMMNVAWFIAFAPVERPEIAVAVAMEGDQPGVEYAGAEHAAPIVREMIVAYMDKK